ncbi:hypothetical protein MXE31_11120, partial [Acinetobacter baumannii]|nr:hypothetical protein [Acinetobacter baumannii]
VDLGYNSEAEKQGLAKMYALLERTLKYGIFRICSLKCL